MADREPSITPFDDACDAWRLPGNDPTTLIVPWPDAEPPTITEVTAAIESATGAPVELVEELDGDELVVWNRVVRVNGLATPVIVWLEPSRPLDVEPPGFDRGPWVLGLETMLDDEQPLEDFVELVRIAVRAAGEGTGVLDVNAGIWHGPQDVDDLFLSSEVGPPTEILWSIHAVSDDDADRAWLHTHGLWRCGRPELEMLDVPADLAPAAGQLLNGMAELLLEHELPPPGEPFEVGVNLYITVQPWQTVAPYLPEGTPGGMPDRQSTDDNPHAGVRAVICATEPAGQFRKVWVCPAEALRTLATDGATIYRSRHETERQATLARTTWPHLATAFATLPPSPEPRVGYLIKAAFTDEIDPNGGREHLWFEIDHMKGDRAQGRLINQPISVRSLREGDETWIEREKTTDWMVFTERDRFGPSDVSALWRTIDEMKEAGGGDGSA